MDACHNLDNQYDTKIDITWYFEGYLLDENHIWDKDRPHKAVLQLGFEKGRAQQDKRALLYGKQST